MRTQMSGAGAYMGDAYILYACTVDLFIYIFIILFIITHSGDLLKSSHDDGADKS